MMAAPAVLFSAKTRQQLLMMVALPAVLKPAKASDVVVGDCGGAGRAVLQEHEHAVVDDDGAAGGARAVERDAAEESVEDRRVARGARIAEFDQAGVADRGATGGAVAGKGDHAVEGIGDVRIAGCAAVQEFQVVVVGDCRRAGRARAREGEAAAVEYGGGAGVARAGEQQVGVVVDRRAAGRARSGELRRPPIVDEDEAATVDCDAHSREREIEVVRERIGGGADVEGEALQRRVVRGRQIDRVGEAEERGPNGHACRRPVAAVVEIARAGTWEPGCVLGQHCRWRNEQRQCEQAGAHPKPRRRLAAHFAFRPSCWRQSQTATLAPR